MHGIFRPSAFSRRYSYIKQFRTEKTDHCQPSSTGMASDTGSEIGLHNINQTSDYDANDESPIETQRSPIQMRQHENHSTLPPVDGGRQAWLFLAGSFSIEALVWGKLLFSGCFAQSPTDPAWCQLRPPIRVLYALILRFVSISPF